MPGLWCCIEAVHFYPRSPRGERPAQSGAADPVHSEFLSTLPARGATFNYQSLKTSKDYFYPRSPRGERPGCRSASITLIKTFLSTLPARGATSGWKKAASSSGHFYPRSPRGERLSPVCICFTAKSISIHAPREGSDCFRVLFSSLTSLFLSTLPARGATVRT